MSVRQPRERVAADSPLLDDLNDEDLTIAQEFHHAETPVRHMIQAFLREPDAVRIVALVRRLHHLPALWLPIFEDLLAAAERGSPPHGTPPADPPTRE